MNNAFPREIDMQIANLYLRTQAPPCLSLSLFLFLFSRLARIWVSRKHVSLSSPVDRGKKTERGRDW